MLLEYGGWELWLFASGADNRVLIEWFYEIPGFPAFVDITSWS